MKKRKILIRFAVAILLAAPVIVLIAFVYPITRNTSQQLVVADWMVFATGVLSYVGTVCFGSAVYIQSERFQKIENERIRVQNLPVFSLQRFHYADLEKHATKTLSNQLVLEYTKTPENGQSDNRININGISIYKNKTGDVCLSGAYDHPSIASNRIMNMLILTNCGNNTANSIHIYIKETLSEYDRMFCLLKDDGIVLLPSAAAQFTLVVEYHDVFMNHYQQNFEFSLDEAGSLVAQDILPDQLMLSRGDLLSMKLDVPQEEALIDTEESVTVDKNSV